MSKEKKEKVFQYVSYFNENVLEDEDDILTICETAGKQLHERFHIHFVNPETGKIDPRLVGACFGKIFEAILISLEKFERQQYSDFEMNICNRLVIGYSTSSNDDDEKQGNFMIYIRHLNNNKKNDELDDPSLSASERSVQWNSVNITDQTEIIKQISLDALTTLKEIEVRLVSSECVMPIFITVYESIINYLKIVRREHDEFEHEINFINCFFVGARISEDGTDDIYFRPNIDSKLRLKNDSIATSKFE